MTTKMVKATQRRYRLWSWHVDDVHDENSVDDNDDDGDDDDDDDDTMSVMMIVLTI